MMSAAILYGLVAMLASGVSSALLKHATSSFGTLPTVIARSGISALVLLAALAIVRPDITYSPDVFAFAIALSILGYFPFMFFVTGINTGKVGVVAPVSSGWLVIAAAASFFLFGETFPPLKLLAFGLIVAGVVFSSIRLTEWKTSNIFSMQSGVIFALAAAFLWGIVFPLFKIPSEYFGALFFACMIECLVCLSGCAHFFLTKQKLPAFENIQKGWWAVFTAGILTALFTFSVSEGYLTGEVSIVSALAGSAIVVSVVLASILYQERLSRMQYIGAGLVLLGIVLAAMI